MDTVIESIFSALWSALSKSIAEAPISNEAKAQIAGRLSSTLAEYQVQLEDDNNA